MQNKLLHARVVANTLLFLLLGTGHHEVSAQYEGRLVNQGQIVTQYDRFRDQTTVEMREMYLQGEPPPNFMAVEYLSMSAAFTSPGAQISIPTNITLWFAYLSMVSKFDSANSDVIAIADGARIRLGRIQLDYYRPSSVSISARGWVNVDYETLRQLADARNAELLVGRQNVFLAPKHIRAIKKLLDTIPAPQPTPSPMMPTASGGSEAATNTPGPVIESADSRDKQKGSTVF